MTDVFISYSRKDIAFARLLHQALKENDLETWIDWQDIPPSADWLTEVYEAIEQTDTFIFIISPTSVSSEICSMEIAHAAKHHKRLIPIVINDIDAQSVPSQLAALNWIFFKEEDQDYRDAVQDLITAIQVDQEWLKAHTRYQNRALEWERKGQESGFLLRGGDLGEGEAWLARAAEKDPQPTALQTRYMLASRQDATRRQRAALGAICVALVVAVALGILAWTQRNLAVSEGNMRATAQAEAEISSTQAVEQKNEAERQASLARAGLYSVESLSHLDDQLSLALLLSVEAISNADTVQSRSSLLSALTHNPSIVLNFHGHQGPVSNVTFSPDGKIMATAGCSLPGPSRGHMTCEQGEILLWDAESGELLDVLVTPHPVFISNLVFSPDSSLLVSSDWNGNIVVWDVNERQPLGDPLFNQFGRVLDLTFSPDGKYFVSSHELLSGSTIGGELRVWDPGTLELIKLIPRPFVLPYSNLVITPDGQFLIAAQQSSTSIALWDINTWERVPGAFEGYEDVVRSMDLSPDGERLVLGNYDGSLMLWDLTNMQLVNHPLSGHTDLINKVSFSPDGKTIISVSIDQTIRLWDAVTWQAIGEPFATLTEEITDVAFHPENGTFATSGQEGSVTLWSPAPHTSIGQVLPWHKDAVWDVGFTSNGDTLASASADHTIGIWDMSAQPNLIRSLEGNLGQIYSLDFSPDDSLLASGGQSGVHIWDWREGRQVLAMLRGQEEPVVCLDFSPDGKILASGGMDSKIILWDASTGEMIGEPLEGHHATVNDLAFSPSGEILASVGCSSTDTQYCERGEMILWDLSGHQISSQTLTIHAHNVWTLAFSPDGDTIATGSADETIRFWDAASGEPVGDPILGHEIGVTSLAFSPDGAVLASGGIDATILLTDLASRQRIGPPLTRHEASVSSLAFSPDGESLVSGSHDSQVLLWVLDSAFLKEKACQRAGRNLTQAEWLRYFPGVPYRKTCPDLPEG
ncbi:MAG: TIR domain-containing protein [Anaerolineales bacterium]|nr:TIR domain-containing protein [Anaerolineales bacterium]